MAANGDADSPTDTINPAFPDESPTLPPTPGDHNGQENYDPTPRPSSTSSQNQSSISSPSFTDSLHNIPERTTFERLDRLQSTSAFSNDANSSYTVNSPHYFHVTSPISQPQYPQQHQTSALISPSPSSPGRAPNRIMTPQSMSSNQRDSIASGSQSPIIPAPNRRHPSHHYRGEGRRNHHGETHIPLTPPAPVPPAPAPAMYWSKIRTFGKVPKPLRSHTAILVEEQVFVFGGCDSRTCFNSVYVFDADTMYWNKPRTLGDPPPPCRAHSSTKVGKKLYIFGGGDGPTYFNDLYIFDTDTLTWTKPQTSGDTPTPRRAHTTEHYNNCIYIFGGGDGVCALNDVYMLDISDLSNLIWKRLEPSGGPPISRGYHTSNLVDNKLVIFGGSDGHECFDDVYVLDLEKNTWTKIDVSNSHRRLSHTSTQVGSYLFVVGGHDGTKYTSEVLLLNLVIMEWEPRSVFGTPPSGRGYHTTVLYDSRLFVFGGYDGHSVFDDVYILDLSACAYLPQIINFKLLEKTDAI